MPFNDLILIQLKDRLTKHLDITDSFSSLLPSGRELVISQTGSFLKLAGFYNTDLLKCNGAILEAELNMWHQRYSNETASRIPQKSAIDDLGQSGENFYPKIYVLLKKIFAILPTRTSTSERSCSTPRGIKRTCES